MQEESMISSSLIRLLNTLNIETQITIRTLVTSQRLEV